jgi:hypothetical protein
MVYPVQIVAMTIYRSPVWILQSGFKMCDGARMYNYCVAEIMETVRFSLARYSL